MNLSRVFQTVLSMSLTGSVVIVLVLLARWGLKRLPRRVGYGLWAVVLFRLLCPVALSAPVSLIPAPMSDGTLVARWSQQYVDHVSRLTEDTVGYQLTLEAGRTPVEEGGETYIPAKVGTVQEPDTVGTTLLVTLGWVWAAGAVIMAGYGLVSHLRLRRRLVGAMPVEKGVYLCDGIPTPFVLGLLRPRIYLPSNLTEEERRLVLAHEGFHLKRFDHVAKCLGFMALCVHWFNPLAWVAYICAVQDMEMSCDEAVVGQLGEEIREDYAACLLRLSTGHGRVSPTPLAFGEGDTGARIRHLSRWKLPRAGGMVWAVVGCLTLSACMATNPVTPTVQPSAQPTPTLTPEQLEELGPYRTMMGNDTVYVLEDENHENTPEQAAQILAQSFLEDLKKPSEDRTFRLIQYQGPTVEVTPVLEMDEASQSNYRIQPSEKREDCWVVEVSVICVYEGSISPMGESPDEWMENLHEGSPVGFLLRSTDTGYTFQSRCR